MKIRVIIMAQSIFHACLGKAPTRARSQYAFAVLRKLSSTIRRGMTLCKTLQMDFSQYQFRHKKKSSKDQAFVGIFKSSLEVNNDNDGRGK